MSLKIVSVIVASVALGLSVFSAPASPSLDDLTPDTENVPANKSIFALIQFEGVRDGLPTKGLLIYGPLPDNINCTFLVKQKVATFGRMGFQVAGKCVEQPWVKEEDERVNNNA